MAKTLTKLSSGKVEITGDGKEPITIPSSYSPEKTATGAALRRAVDGKIMHEFIAGSGAGQVTQIVEVSGNQNNVTNSQELYDALKLVFDDAGASALTTEVTGWGEYIDGEYTTGSPYTLTTGAGNVALPNSARTIREGQKPADILTFYYANKLNFTGLTGMFQQGEEVTGGTSGATGDVVEVGADYLLINNLNGVFVDTETLTGGTSGANATQSGAPEAGKITGRSGDGLNFVIEFKVRPTSAVANPRVVTAIDIAGAVGEIYKRDFVMSKGQNQEHYFVSSIAGFTLDTWEQNGGEVKVQAIGSDVEIYDIRLVLTRTHKAR